VRAAGAEPVVCDLEHAGEDEVAGALAGADAVVFAAGAGPGSGPERKWTMDHGGAVKLAAAAAAAGARRYVMVSSMGADPDADDSDGGFGVYLKAKGMADADVLATELDVTIIRPGGLTDDAGTGQVELARASGAARCRATTWPPCSPPSCTSPARPGRRWSSSAGGRRWPMRSRSTPDRLPHPPRRKPITAGRSGARRRRPG
jgi:uncharacterized protein YbjT (DUF2867 family)